MILLPRVVGLLDAAGIRHCLIGATAAAMYGIVRATLDVDLLTTDKRVLQPETWGALSDAEVQIHRGDLEDSLLGTARINTASEAVDVVVGAKTWMADIVACSVPVTALGTTLARPSLADLVVLKLDAGSVRDRADVVEMLDSGVEPALLEQVQARLAPLPSRYRKRWEALLHRRDQDNR